MTAASQGLQLTERELQVLVGMSEGKPNAEIGRDLYVSEDTVKTHARRLFKKLGARDRAHAVAIGCRSGALDQALGIVQPPEQRIRQAATLLAEARDVSQARGDVLLARGLAHLAEQADRAATAAAARATLRRTS